MGEAGKAVAEEGEAEGEEDEEGGEAERSGGWRTGGYRGKLSDVKHVGRMHLRGNRARRSAIPIWEVRRLLWVSQ